MGRVKSMVGVSRRGFAATGLMALGGAALPGLAGASQQRAEIPFLVTRNHIWTGVMLDDQGPYPFLLDTGATWYFVDPDVAEKVGLKKTGQLDKVHTAAGMTNEPVYQARRIAIANKMAETNISLIALREDRNDITKGLIPLSSHAAVWFDFDAKRMIVDRDLGRIPDGYQQLELQNARGWASDTKVFDLPGGEVDPDNGHDATHMRRKLLTRQPIIDAKLDGQPIRLMVDTGEPGGLLIYPSYVRTHRLWDHYAKSTPSVSRALDKDVKTRIVRPERLSFGDLHFDKPIISLADPTSAGNGYGLYDGVIGVEIARRMNFIIDPIRRVAAFKPNAAFDDVWRYDRGGLSIERVGDHIEITEVAEGGPAWRSGLRKGDVVTGWAGGQQAPGASPYFSLLWALQGEPGTRLGIQIAKGDGGLPQVVAVTLEERL